MDVGPSFVSGLEMTIVEGIFADIEGPIVSFLDNLCLFFLTCLHFVSIVVGVHPVVIISLTVSNTVLGRCILLYFGLPSLLIPFTVHSF